MKKALAFILPFVMLASAFSCSKDNTVTEPNNTEAAVTEQVSETTENETTAEPETESPETEAASEVEAETADEDDDPAEGTNYTTGTFEDGVYTNEFANIRMNIPEELSHIPDVSLQQQKEKSISALTEESDIIREKAVIWDSMFANSSDCMYIRFVNTRKGFPDSEDMSVEQMLDDNKEWTNNFAESTGASIEWKDRENVMLGGEEYIRDVYYINSDYCYLYMRRIDEDFICSLYFNGKTADNTPEYYESLFE